MMHTAAKLEVSSRMQDFKKLRVWHLARRLRLAVVDALPEKATRKVPGLRNQAIRAATSVESNIAEGCGSGQRTQFLHFVEIALASMNELEEQLRLAYETRILDEPVHSRQQDTIDLLRRMLVALMRALQRQIAEDEMRRRDDRRTA
jgi:four helix bundle protein